MPTYRIPCLLLAALLLAPSAIAQSYSGFNPQEHVLTGPPNSATSAEFVRSVFAADLDGDGDADVLSASQGDDKVAWYENLTVNLSGPSSPGSFGVQQVITTSTGDPRSVYATDLDGDGDADVLSASHGDDKIAWYENLLFLPTPLPASGNVQFQFVYTRGSGFSGDLTIDNVCIF